MSDVTIRVPAIMHWPNRIPGGQVLDEPCASMDIVPILIRAAGGDIEQFEIDGVDILPFVADGQPLPERSIYWEMGDQRAVRHAPRKLVLNGRLVEDASVNDAVHLSNLDDDSVETINLANAETTRTASLKQDAETWRISLEEQWTEWQNG